jgi:hypothetical protein
VVWGKVQQQIPCGDDNQKTKGKISNNYKDKNKCDADAA